VIKQVTKFPLSVRFQAPAAISDLTQRIWANY